MTDRNEIDEFDPEPLEGRLRSSRSSLTAVELDQVKRRVISRAGRPQMNMKHRLATALLVVGLVGTGGGAVLAASHGNGDNNGNGNGSANSQYCPPSSPGHGKPKTPHDGGAKCGHPNGGNDQDNGNGGQGQGNGKGNGKH
jgi:hypothetical protein